ncbi:MAG: pimeloyl-CoA dehydrogenase small subunit [Rhodospirillales bacterium]|nr:pimeloyl-CoA dehydrogenase small subunit [Rhodospirillales bacterium]
MDFRLSEEQALMKQALTRFAANLPQSDACEHGAQDRLWAELVSLGLVGVSVPQDLGGAGGGPVETMIVMEALGSALVCSPYLETVVIGGAILKRRPGFRSSALLKAILAGAARIAFAAYEPQARFELSDVATVASRDGDSWVLNGAKAMVEGAGAMTHAIVSARTSGGQRDADGVSLFIVEKSAPGVTIHAYPLIDGRSGGDIVLTDVRVEEAALVGAANQSGALIEQVIDEACAAICAEGVGIMQKLLDDTIAYTAQRRQFGHSLSALQALQHRMVDMYMALEQAKSATLLATLNLDTAARARAKAVSAAKATVSASARMISQNAVQLHGGMGMTNDMQVARYFRRATTLQSQFGSRDHHLARYAALDVAA